MSVPQGLACWFAITTILVASPLQSAAAARVPWCMRVVPSGELVIRYGASWCK